MKKYRIGILGNTGENPISAYSWFVKTTAQGMMLNGHDVMGFDYKFNPIGKIYKFLKGSGIEILFTHLTFHHHHDTERMMELFEYMRVDQGIKIIHTMQDARTEPRYKKDISQAFDMALIGQVENIPKFQNYWKVPVYYWPYSSLTYDKIGNFKKELCFNKPVFPGNPMSHQDRSDFIKRLQAKLPITVLKTKSGVDLRKKTLDFSWSTPCILGLCTRYEDPLYGYYEVRPWQYLGAGANVILRPYKGFENVVDPKYYYTINGYGYRDIFKVKEYWLRMKKDREEKKRREVFNFIQKYHSSRERMRQTIELIEGKRKKLSIFLDEI